MSEEQLIVHCSPTLAGIKTGNIFNCPYEDISRLNSFIQKWNGVLNPKGVYIRLLRACSGIGLIYVYRPSFLMSDIDGDAAELLKSCGYAELELSAMLENLSRRLNKRAEFPHEIGLFLGYPLADVKGFIENKGAGCKLVGFWKVYGDAVAAEKKFSQFKKCSALYYSNYKKGRSISKLTVAK